VRADIVKRFTDLGDPTLLLLGGLAMFFYLWIDDGRRAVAGAWATSLGLCIALTIASKLLFYLHGWSQHGPLRLYSPSGHVAIATAFYGNCAMLLATGHGKTFSLAVFGGTAVLIAFLAVSRMLLGLHSAPEIAVALAIGLASLSPFHLSLATRPIVLRAGQPIALLVLIGVVRVSNVDGEALVAHLARNIASMGAESPIASAARTLGIADD
jgi:hypothetical protein